EEYSLDAFSPTIAANDKAMYKFEEGDTVDFGDSAYDGAYKSAILKGCTLVNLINNPNKNITSHWGSFQIVNDLKANTIYTISIESPIVQVGVFTSFSPEQVIKSYTNGTFSFNSGDNTSVRLYIRHQDNSPATPLPNEYWEVVMCEGDYANANIPYFTGMQSVKMPVLTTVGKNLFDGISFKKWWVNASEGVQKTETGSNKSILINIKPNTKYSLSGDGINRGAYAFLNANFEELSHGGSTTGTRQTEESPSGSKYLLWYLHNEDISNCSNIQVEEGAVATSYEPYKSNILSTPSDLVLGKVGDVEDTLNLLTGEVVEQTEELELNVTSVVFDSVNNNNLDRFVVTSSTLPKSEQSINSNAISNNGMIAESNFNYGSDNTFSYSNSTKKFYFTFTKDTVTSEELLNKLTTNKMIIRFKKITPVVKTVDLSGTPFGYKGGHIIKSSAEGSLLPKFEYEVAVSRGAQISQNTSTLIKHDEKITELLKKTAATYINQKAEIAHLLNMSNTLEEAQTIPFIEDDYVNDDCMVDSDMVMDDMELEPEKEIIDNVDTLLINLIYDLIELNDTLGLSEKVELFRQSGLIDKHNYEIIKEKLNPSFKEEDYADIN
ncbi:MAG: hypothetical protein J6D33_01080, partial [Turicibacter sp.]|nr:hypothetical protein [Turicibacter sp.]